MTLVDTSLKFLASLGDQYPGSEKEQMNIKKLE